MDNYDDMMREVRRGFTAIENDLDLSLHDQYVRLARMDLLARRPVPLPEPGPEDTVVYLPAPATVFGPRAVYGPITNPYSEAIVPTSVQLHASLPWWRRWMRRRDRRLARDLGVSA